MLNIDRIQVGTTTYYIMDTVARSSLSTKVDSTDIYTTTEINNFLEAKANSADLGDLALLDSISYISDLLTNKPTLGTMASKDDAASDNKQYVRKNGSWSEVSIPTLEWGQISGTLSNQTDLANALSTKANTADLGSLATKNSVDYSSNEVTNKPTLGTLASKNKVDWDTDIDDIPSSFPPSSHTHDDRYYTESEIDTALLTKAPLASPVFTGTPTAPTATDGTNNTQIATTQFVHNAFKANDAMVFKGTIGSSNATVTSLPATHYKGWTYKVITAGTYAGQTCEIGDMIICVTDGTSATDSHWTVVQSNVDGAVTGPASATDTHIATFNGTSGKVIQDSGYTIGKSVPSDAVFTDTTYTNGDGITLSGTTFAANFPISGTPAALGTASNGSATTVARSDHVHAKPSYGNINTSGAITSDTAVANGDKIVVTDSSNSSKLIRTGIAFDGSTTTKALTPKGTWETFNNYSLPEASADTLGGIKVGTNLSINDGVLSATDTTYNNATTTTAGLMSSSDKSKLDGIASGANNYTLPTATSTTKGGIKIGNNLSMNDEILNAVDTTYSNGNGISLSGTTFSAAFPTSGTPADLGTASNGSSNNVARADHVHKKPTYTKSDVGLGNVTNDAQIPKSIGTSTGDLIYFTDDATPSRLSIGTDNQVLKAVNGVPTWSSLSTFIEDAPDDSEYMRKNGEWFKPLLGYLAFMNTSTGIEIYMVTKPS